MLKICLCSDNHGDLDSIRKILSDNPNCDYYLHCGDACLDEKLMEPFVCVRGNNDYYYDFPKIRIFNSKFHRIMIIHGDGYTYNLNKLAAKAKQESCDVVFYGHTHRFDDEYVDGVRLINPGSTYHNRDLSSPCYAIVNINNEGKIEVNRINLE